MRTPLAVAQDVLLAVLDRLEKTARCDFCPLNADGDGDGDGDHHADDCPLAGFEMTVDAERLRASPAHALRRNT